MSLCAIVLSTYNGEKYLPEQLDSLVNQSRRPDRIYIRDDCSNDGTVKLIREFAETHPEIRWDVHTNEQNKGWQTNFRDMITDAEEEILFLCDQDDIWDERKIEIMARIIENHPEMDLLACGYEPVYMDNESTISSRYSRGIDGTGEIRQIPFDERFMYVLRPGCTYGIRKRFVQEIQPYWIEEKAHDAILWRYAALKGTGFMLNQPLIRWRRYRNSSSSKYNEIKDRTSAAEIRYRYIMESLTSNTRFLQRMAEYCEEQKVEKEKNRIAQETLQHTKRYCEAIREGAAAKILRIGLRDRRFFLSWKTPVADALMVIMKN